MLSIYKNDYLKIIISFLLIFLILINFGTNIYMEKVYADFVLAPLAMKTFAVILGSMGVLTVINSSQGGFNSFYHGFLNFMEETKGIYNTVSDLSSLVRTSILTNAKMKVSSFATYIKEYYNKWSMEHTPDSDIEYIDGLLFSDTVTLTGTVSDINDMAYNVTKELQSGYSLRIFSYGADKFRAYLVHNGERIDSSIVDGLRFVPSGHRFYRDDSISFKFTYQVSSNMLVFNCSILNYTQNISFPYTKSATFSTLVDLKGHEGFVPTVYPKALDVPSEIAYPSTNISNSTYKGKTIDELLEGVSSQAIGPFVAELENMGYQNINAAAPFVIVPDITTSNPDGTLSGSTVIEDIRVPDIPAVGEQTGILSSILSTINSMWDWLKGLFTIESSYIMTKITDLQALINDKVGLPSMSPLTGLFGSIKGLPIPSNKYVNADFINSLAFTVRDWQRFFWYVVLMLFGANKVYKLVRKDDLIKFRNAD